MSSTVLEVYD